MTEEEEETLACLISVLDGSVSEDAARAALNAAGGNMDAAIHMLFEGSGPQDGAATVSNPALIEKQSADLDRSGAAVFGSSTIEGGGGDRSAAGGSAELVKPEAKERKEAAVIKAAGESAKPAIAEVPAVTYEVAGEAVKAEFPAYAGDELKARKPEAASATRRPGESAKPAIAEVPVTAYKTEKCAAPAAPLVAGEAFKAEFPAYAASGLAPPGRRPGPKVLDDEVVEGGEPAERGWASITDLIAVSPSAGVASQVAERLIQAERLKVEVVEENRDAALSKSRELAQKVAKLEEQLEKLQYELQQKSEDLITVRVQSRADKQRMDQELQQRRELLQKAEADAAAMASRLEPPSGAVELATGAAEPTAQAAKGEDDAEVREKVADLNLTRELTKIRQANGIWEKHFAPRLMKDIKDMKDSIKEKLPALRDALQDIIRNMCDRLIDRDEAVRVLLLAVVAGQNVLLFGPPGTAKSAVTRLLSQYISDCAEKHGGAYFEAQFHPSTTVEDIFGPISLKDLERGRLQRRVGSMLPYASIAFLDEAFKAQASLLSCLLSVLNERCFRNGDQMLQDLPLMTTIVASNEVPLDAGAGALFDRLLLRVFVGYVDRSSDPKSDPQNMVMNSKFTAHEGAPKPVLSLEDLKLLRNWAKEHPLLKFPADRDDKDPLTWKRHLSLPFVLFKKDEATKLIGYLSEDGGVVSVSRDVAEEPVLHYQDLRKGWVLLGQTSLDALRASMSLGDQASEGSFPHILYFRKREAEQVKIYDLVMVFVKEVRRMDSEEAALAAVKKLSVEGGGRLSDRRLKQVVDLLRLVAATNKRERLIVPDLYAMAWCCWKTKRDWDHLSTFWLRRLKAELQAMSAEDRKTHHPENNIWLPSKVEAALREAIEGDSAAARSHGALDPEGRAIIAEVQQRERAKVEELNKKHRDHMAVQQEAEKAWAQQQQLMKQAEMDRKKAELESQKQQNQLLDQELDLRAADEAIKQRQAEQAEREIQLRQKAAQREKDEVAKHTRQLKAIEEANAKMEGLMRAEMEKNKTQAENGRKKVQATKELGELMGKEQTQANIDKVRELLGGRDGPDTRADVNAIGGESTWADTCFTEAIYKFKSKFLACMVEAKPLPNPNHRDNLGDPPLVMACKYGEFPDPEREVICNILIVQMGCSVSATGSKDGNNPIHYLCQYGDKPTLAYFLRQPAARPLLYTANNEGKTPMDFAWGDVKSWLSSNFPKQ